MRRLDSWAAKMAARTWQDPPWVRLLRARSARTAARLLVGTITGATIGGCTAAAGVYLSGADLSRPGSGGQATRIIAAFALASGAVLALVADSSYFYMRWVTGRGRWAPPVNSEFSGDLWDGAIDGLPIRHARDEKDNDTVWVDSSEV